MKFVTAVAFVQAYVILSSAMPFSQPGEPNQQLTQSLFDDPSYYSPQLTTNLAYSDTTSLAPDTAQNDLPKYLLMDTRSASVANDPSAASTVSSNNTQDQGKSIMGYWSSFKNWSANKINSFKQS
ncbi:hypothetical protein H4R33_001248 [Dimargaris cristalligena]|uniref:Uncharacterized protein n=1 Tax=Dimargaris cristalligena TaxID=215637 RepID=A0A4P9ZRA6_9FUNG|nr:hypothetical protein H4R33_001248 [Dimargaris cristalligena]RKP36056.1 hypothetical protein BJ085DRAFT_27398 [Dimargaris cristalligena]|eukprot:RKP36056.1 hypothetical protein BJ085DRAFT_27398 [Dimargaris cristalligena]